MEQKLEAYRRKRNFLKTSEPSGKEKKAVGVKKRKIFAVQLHYARTTHFDFRLEWDGVLLSWAVPKGPSFNPKDKRLAVRVEEHPLDYADFEGVIPKGEYGGGTVLLWDKGYWTETEDFARGLEKGSLKLRLDGKRLKGGWALVRLNDKDKAEDEKENWLLFKEKDSFAKDTSGLTGRERSVKSGLSAKGIAEKAAVAAAEIPFNRAPVMLCRQGCRAAVGKRLGLRNKIRRLPYRGVFAKGRGTAFDAQRKRLFGQAARIGAGNRKAVKRARARA